MAAASASGSRGSDAPHPSRSIPMATGARPPCFFSTFDSESPALARDSREARSATAKSA